MNNYLIPANSKRSMLIFGLFKPFDLILFLSGMSISIILMLILPMEQVIFATIALAPGLLCGFLVLPIPNYHNMLQVIHNMIEFYTNRQRFIWKGWCFPHEETSGKK